MSLVHYWPLDEASGSVALDTVGGLGEGVVVDDANDTILEQGKFGRARRLNPNGLLRRIHLYTGAEDFNDTLSEWSISLWFRLDDPGLIGGGYLFSFGGYTENANTVEVAIWSSDPVHHQNWAGVNNTISLWVYGPAPGYAEILDESWSLPGGENVFPEPTAETLLDKDHLLVVTCDGQNIALYLDGEQVISGAGSAALSPWTAANYVGGDSSSSDHFGWVDDIAIWDDALSSSDIECLWSGGDGVSALAFAMFSAEPAPLFDPNPSASRYSYLDIDDGVADPIRIPISSWQATLQADRANFVQAVIPNVGEWITSVSARRDSGEIIIYHTVRETDGSEQEWEAARAPLQQFLTDQGPLRFTGRVVGYATASLGNPCVVRVLRNIRSVSTSAGLRVRCDYDPTLRPGETVRAGELEFRAAYINAYCTDSDRYMDVGERAL